MENTENILKQKTRKATIDGQEYILEEMLWTESMQLTNEYTDFDYDAGTSDIDDIELNIQRILRCLKTAPFDITEDNIRRLPESIGNKLMMAMRDWFRIPKDEEKK